MIPLPPELVKAVRFTAPRFDASPIQLRLGRDPWKVMVSSQLLQRTRRNPEVLERVLTAWPTPEALSLSDVALEFALMPLGLHRTRARALQRASARYHEGRFQDIRELPGCGPYVCDAVGLFCFGCTELESFDTVLRNFVAAYVGPSMWHHCGTWVVSNQKFATPADAVRAYEELLCAETSAFS